jgi:hypothetical protein
MKNDSKINIKGQTSKKGADMIGKIYAIATLIVAIGISTGAVIMAIAKLIPVL